VENLFLFRGSLDAQKRFLAEFSGIVVSGAGFNSVAHRSQISQFRHHRLAVGAPEPILSDATSPVEQPIMRDKPEGDHLSGSNFAATASHAASIFWLKASRAASCC